MKSNKNIVLLVASTGIFFEALDIAIVNLAMPMIQQSFLLANDQVQWMQSLYILFYGLFLIIGGKLADHIGRRNTFLLGNGIFLLTSLGAALSFRFDMLVAFRSIQGIGAALMMPSALSIITNTFTDPQSRGRAIGVFGAFAAIGSGSGMSIGGLIATGFGWPAVFMINVPVIAATMVLSLIFIERDGAPTWQGMFQTLVPRSLFRIHSAMLGSGVMFLLGAFFTGFLFVISLLLQNNMQKSAAFAGLILFPFSVLSALTSRFLIPPMLKRLSVYQSSILGMMLMFVGAGLAIAAMVLNYNLFVLLVAFACVTGVGMAVCFTTLTILTLQDVPEWQHGVASGFNTTLYFLGGGTGLAVLSMFIESNGNNEVTTRPLAVLMLFAATAVAVLFYNQRKMLLSERPNS